MAFFPLQTFSISNRAGNWGCCKPTLAGFNTFIRTHKYKMPLIKRLIIQLDLSQSLSQEPSKSGVQGCAMSSETKAGVGLKNIKDFHHICEALVKHFTGLRDIEIQTWCAEISPYRYQQNPDTELIEPKENIPVEKSKNYAAVFTALKMLMNCKNLAKIKILEGGWVNIKPVVQDFVIKVPDAAKLVEYRTPDRSWIQKKPWINFDNPHMNYTLKQWKHGGKKWW